LWVERPIRFAADAARGAQALRGCGLAEVLITALQRNGINTLFPVQAAVVPEVITGARQPCHPGDLCVSVRPVLRDGMRWHGLAVASG
jgi:hypothetical protein